MKKAKMIIAVLAMVLMCTSTQAQKVNLDVFPENATLLNTSIGIIAIVIDSIDRNFSEVFWYIDLPKKAFGVITNRLTLSHKSFQNIVAGQTRGKTCFDNCFAKTKIYVVSVSGEYSENIILNVNRKGKKMIVSCQEKSY